MKLRDQYLVVEFSTMMAMLAQVIPLKCYASEDGGMLVILLVEEEDLI